MTQGNRPICVRPSHLKLGTQSENIKYAWDTGRQPRQHRVVMHSAKTWVDGTAGGNTVPYMGWRSIGIPRETR